MRVVHLVPAMDQGGTEKVVLDLARLLLPYGVETWVLSVGGRLEGPLLAMGARHRVIDLKSKNPLTFFFRAWRLRRVLLGIAPDLVCVHSRVPAWIFCFANRTLGLKWITYAQGANSVSRYSEIMTKGDRVIVPSQFLREFLLANYSVEPRKIAVVSPSVDSRRFAGAAPKTDERVVMAVGRLTPIKGYEHLISTLPEGVKLIIVGGADRHHADYEVYLRQLASGKSVEFAGAQANVEKWLEKASVVVSANTRKPESFGLSIVEAIAMNRPVIAKAFGGAKEIIEDGRNGLLIVDDDFASAIKRIFSPECAGMFTDDLRNTIIDRFSEEHFAKATFKLYQETIQNIS